MAVCPSSTGSSAPRDPSSFLSLALSVSLLLLLCRGHQIVTWFSMEFHPYRFWSPFSAAIPDMPLFLDVLRSVFISLVVRITSFLILSILFIPQHLLQYFIWTAFIFPRVCAFVTQHQRRMSSRFHDRLFSWCSRAVFEYRIGFDELGS